HWAGGASGWLGCWPGSAPRPAGPAGCSCWPGTRGSGRAAWPVRWRRGPGFAGSRWRGGGAGRPAGRRCTGRGCRRCGACSAASTVRSSGRSWGRAPRLGRRSWRRGAGGCPAAAAPPRGGRGAPRRMGAEGAGFRLFDAVAAFLRNAGAGQPLMLVLDDLHAADAPSILLLRFVARELGEARVLVLGAYRDIELDRGHPLAVALAELSREPATRHVPLSGLDEADVARFIQQITGVVPREGVVAAVHRCTEGNPLFVGEVARLLAAEGRLERAGDAAGVGRGSPGGVRAVIGRRVARLPERCGRVLGLAAVFGRDFWLPPLEQLCGVRAGELLDVLDDGIVGGMVAAVPGAPGRLRFGHALIRDALYEGIPVGRRLRLHQQAGEALEAFYQPDLDPHLAELAHHFFEAAAGGGAGKAAGYAERAGRRALAVLAYEEAARLFKMALAALSLARPPGQDRARCRLLLALGDALTRMGERQAAREELLRAAGLARRYVMAEELGQAALAYAGRFA